MLKEKSSPKQLIDLASTVLNDSKLIYSFYEKIGPTLKNNVEEVDKLTKQLVLSLE